MMLTLKRLGLQLKLEREMAEIIRQKTAPGARKPRRNQELWRPRFFGSLSRRILFFGTQSKTLLRLSGRHPPRLCR